MEELKPNSEKGGGEEVRAGFELGVDAIKSVYMQ